MLKIENVEVYGWEAAIRGMRNPLNSWARSDSGHVDAGNGRDSVFCIGKDDWDLMKRLAAGGSTHAKYRRMITVTLDIVAPLYWWKEFDTYKVGTVANSCSTMHKIHAKEFVLDDFSHERLTGGALVALKSVIIPQLNEDRLKYLETKDIQYWDNMIQLLTTSYNQRRTVLLNYEVLTAIYRDRRNHKLREWHTLRDWIESLPHSEIIVR